MHALFAGLTTLDVIHALDHEPNIATKTTSTDHVMAAGGPATNAAVTLSALEKATGCAREAASSISLLSAIGEGMIASAISADLSSAGVHLLDATSADSVQKTPAISSIVEHPGGRMVASTNARIDIDVHEAAHLLDSVLVQGGAPDVVLIDGHNPAIADCVLRVGTLGEPGPDEDPFAHLEAKPSHQRILDGGSWKPWLTPLLGFVDIAVVSADFCPPLLNEPTGPEVASFLAGFGITRTIRTRGCESVQWYWDGREGETEVDQVDAISTLGAGDVFHGAFAWAVGRLHVADVPIPKDPSDLIRFASRIAGFSTTKFGTRSWCEAPEVVTAVEEFLGSFASGMVKSSR